MNCCVAFEAAEQLENFKLEGICTQDIRDGNKKPVRAFVKQLMTLYFLKDKTE